MSLAVSDVQASAEFYQSLLGLDVVSRPGNGGINMGLSDGFLGVYDIEDPGRVHHFCIGVDDFDADRIKARFDEVGWDARVNRNPDVGIVGAARAITRSSLLIPFTTPVLISPLEFATMCCPLSSEGSCEGRSPLRVACSRVVLFVAGLFVVGLGRRCRDGSSANPAIFASHDRLPVGSLRSHAFWLRGTSI